MQAISEAIQIFADSIRAGDIEIYNEISVQHELGIILRSQLGESLKIQFERPVDYFGFERKFFEKKEIDITLFSQDSKYRCAIELKFPRNGQHPEQMFSSCIDILFLEQLVESGFSECYFIMFADDPLFYQGSNKSGIYKFFRGDKFLSGTIQKPTGKKDKLITLSGSYTIAWKPILGKLKFFFLQIQVT